MPILMVGPPPPLPLAMAGPRSLITALAATGFFLRGDGFSAAARRFGGVVVASLGAD